jgi:hypothetical protein
MKRYVFLRYGLLLIAVLLLCFVPWKNVVGTGRTVAAGGRGDGKLNNRVVISDSPENNGNDSDDKNVSGSNDANGLDKNNGSGDSSSDPGDTVNTVNPADTNTSSKQTVDDYPYDIAADRAAYDLTTTDITVGDRMYSTQINDWYTNFQDYKDKTVEIEGYYLDFDIGYIYVGRKGPSCPYCSGGYVSFEIQSDQDLSEYTSGVDWIAVRGILREGSTSYGDGEKKPFYYIEALSIEKLPEVGVETVTD